jgi:Mor family transcriptional regulator
MRVQTTAMRNREIFASYQCGESIGDLARRYDLSRERVGQIIRGERHKIAVSVEAFYAVMRSQKPIPQQ